MRSRFRAAFALTSVALAATIALAGCGGEGGGGSDADPATLAPADTPLFVSGSVRPEGELKTRVEDLIENVTGITDPGERIVDQLDSALADEAEGTEFTYQEDIEPWLGEEAGLFFGHYDGDEFSGVGAVFQTTDSDAAQDFVDKLGESSEEEVDDASYKGLDYKIDGDDETAVGIVDDFLVLTEDKQTFEGVVNVAAGESLDGNDEYSSAIDDLPQGSLAELYIDVGGLIEQSGAAVDRQTLRFYNALGYDFRDSSVLASVVPTADQVEIEASTNLGGATLPIGDAAEFLGSFPADAFLAFAAPDVGERIRQSIGALDEAGIRPDVPPGALKPALARAGVDLDEITGAIEDVGLFVQGTDLRSLGGAVVVTTSDAQAATDIVNSVGTLLRRADARGFTRVTGNAAGFAFRTPELGPKPLVVLAAGARIAVGYGAEAAEAAVSEPGADTLEGSEVFKRAAAALDGTDMTGFVDLGPAITLAENLGLAEEAEHELAKPYLDKLDFLTFGTGEEGDLSVTKVILALIQG